MPSFAQERNLVEDMENEDIQIRQKPNTNGLLSDLLKDLSIKGDTVYALLYKPAECPRCEVTIPNFFSQMNKYAKDKKTLLVTVYNDKEIGYKYNQAKGYKADNYIYATEEEINRIFSFNTEGMIGTYFLKLCTKSGRMTSGGKCGIVSKNFIYQLCERTKILPQHVFTISYYDQNDEYTTIAPTANIPKWEVETLPLTGFENTNFISQVYDNPKFVDSHFFYSDMLENGIMLFKKTDEKLLFQGFLQADSTEKNRFVQLPKEDFEYMKRTNQLFYIALSANIIDKDKIAISYSLPELKLMNEDGHEYIGVFNHPAILTRDINTLKLDSMVSLDFELGKSKYFHMHFAFDWFNDKLWLGCEKLTWPMDGFGKEDIEDSIELNPFDYRFYDTFNPIVAAFDASTGKQAGHYGHLEDCQKKSKTGYYFINDVYTHHDRDFIYGNGYTGSLYVCDSTDIEHPYRKYQAVEIEDGQFPSTVDTTKYYTLEYGAQFDHTFSRCITAIQMDSKNIYCLIRHGKPRISNSPEDRYVYAIINRKTGKRKEYLLPKSTDRTPLGYGIRNDNGKFAPFEFAKSMGKYLVNTYTL